MSHLPRFRRATEADCSDLAILFDAASRRMASWYWSELAEPGQSWFDIGRERIRSLPERPSYHSNWHVAELDGRTIGAFFGFQLEAAPDVMDWTGVLDCLRPMVEMEHVAQGCWLLQAIALFPEYRNRGFSRALLTEAEAAARASGAQRIVLQVEEINQTAVIAYQRAGYHEWTRRPYVSFPGSDDSGDWILMAKDLH
jgi:ribosomal protein S18 acetylase RimI-like enzyme